MVKKCVVTFSKENLCVFWCVDLLSGRATHFFNLRGIFMKTVTFCGHSKISYTDLSKIKEKLSEELKKLITLGATEFLLGGYGMFDLLCAQTIKELKFEYPHIKSVLVIPYINRDFNKTLYDCSEYPPLENVPKKFAISKRNEYMIKKSDAVIAYITHEYGGAFTTFEYAKKHGLNCVNLYKKVR